jgi:hypothetical protein
MFLMRRLATIFWQSSQKPAGLNPGGFSIVGINLKFIALAGGRQLLTAAPVAHPTEEQSNDGKRHAIIPMFQRTLSHLERRSACRASKLNPKRWRL